MVVSALRPGHDRERDGGDVRDGARRGTLIKGGTHLEDIGRVTAVVFDKTGTLTLGRPLVTSVVTLDESVTADEVLSLAASGELHAHHPLAEAIVRQLTDLGVTRIVLLTGDAPKPPRPRPTPSASPKSRPRAARSRTPMRQVAAVVELIRHTLRVARTGPDRRLPLHMETDQFTVGKPISFSTSSGIHDDDKSAGGTRDGCVIRYR
ncbi:HAD family hydrolase [Streptomyces coeruleorubidus]